jgi:hypothetical protein
MEFQSSVLRGPLPQVAGVWRWLTARGSYGSPTQPPPQAEIAKSRRALLIIALAALGLRMFPVLTRSDLGWAMEPNGDSAAYIELALGLKKGCGFAHWTTNRCASTPESNRTPGYPLWLSIMPGLRAALLMQALMSAVLSFCVGLFAAALAGASSGICAAALLALDVPSIVSSCQIMSETLFTTLLTGAVLIELEVLVNCKGSLANYALLALASVMFGLALLVRPVAEFIVPVGVFAPLLLGRCSVAERLRLGALVAAGPLLCGTAWMVRNYKVAGVAALSTIGSLNFFYYRAIGTLAFASRRGWTATLLQTHPVPNIGLFSQAGAIILRHPVAFIAMTLWSFLYLCWVPDRAPLARILGVLRLARLQNPGSVRIEAVVHQLWRGNVAGLGAIFAHEFYASSVLLSLVVLQLLMMAFTWLGVALALKKYASLRSPMGSSILFVFAIAAVTLVLAAGPEAVARFRVPATPLLGLMAGIGWFGPSLRATQQ